MTVLEKDGTIITTINAELAKNFKLLSHKWPKISNSGVKNGQNSQTMEPQIDKTLKLRSHKWPKISKCAVKMLKNLKL